MNRMFLVFLPWMSIWLLSCEQAQEIVLPKYQPKHIHEGYQLSLTEAGLASTALGRDWITASSKALLSPISIKAPYEEEFYILADEVKAYGYKVEGTKGQVIKVSLEQTAGDSTLIFLDAYRIDQDSIGSHKLIASANEAERSLAFEVVEDGSFIIRFQHELLRKGQFKIRIIKVPSLAFPVEGGKTYDIGSLFGVSRDAGKRTHKGIDIFARRHTPIIAPTNGKISWAGVREGSLGGKVIWMRDTVRNQTLYFAHLQDVFVTKGDNVIRGDTIGSVGNSGNAITTAPHLHFGIYQPQGAVDPYAHVVTTKTRPSRILPDTQLLGQLARTKRNTKLKSQRLDDNEVITLDKHQLVKVIGRFASYYKVSTPAGTEGYIFYDDLTPIKGRIKKITCSNSPLLDTPFVNGIILRNIIDEEVNLLASNSDHLYVQTSSGQTGWIHI